jgi:uncharacterized protein (DUF58 family)
MALIQFDADFMRRLEQLQLVSRKLFRGGGKGERRSRRRGLSVEFVDYRNYVAGDDLRYLDWNLYGRLDQLFLKLYEEEEELRVTFLVDTSGSMDFGMPTKLEHALKLTAAMSYVGLSAADMVRIASFSGALRDVERSASGRHQALRVFRALEALEAGGPTALNTAVHHLVTKIQVPGLAIVISDFLDEEGYEQGFRQLLGRGFEVFAVHVMAPEELEPRWTGDLRLVDSETAEVREISMGQTTLSRYRDAVEGFCGELEHFCTNRGIHYMRTLSTDPVDRICLHSLRRMGMIR